MQTHNPIRLTQTVQKGGCAAKVAASELRKILSQIRFPPAPPELMIHTGTFDDAAIYRVNSDLALVQTLDFFTPIVDTPRIYGRIAAVNALSDVYAMGGKPITTMAILAYPLSSLSNDIIVEVLQGASEAIEESGASLVGGHTIDDESLKFGLSVTGFVHPEYIWSNAGAKVGDSLILTKPLGTGALTAALKRGELSETDIQDGIDSMCTLNNIKEQINPKLWPSIHAATDVTGFGLAGHALHMANASRVSFQIDSSRLPCFEKTMELIAKGFLTKAHRTNREYAQNQIEFEHDNSNLQQLVFDPQTSGGILLSVDSECTEEIISDLSRKFKFAQKIGSVYSADKTAIRFL